jgi:hypothetical protein
MNSLRLYVRCLLKESRFRQMSKPVFTNLRSHLANAPFLDKDAGGDYDGEYDELSSEAQQQLIVDLGGYLDKHFGVGEISLTVKVNHLPTLPTEGYNKALHGAVYYFDGLHNIELLIASMEDGETLRELGDVGKKVYEVVLHELLHMQQFIKFSKGAPTVEKWNEFKKSYEENNISNSDEDYFFFDPANGPSELETFSLQIANELFSDLGKKEAMSLLPSRRATRVPDISTLKKSSASVRSMASRGVKFDRSEFLDMLKRSRQYISRMS